MAEQKYVIGVDLGTDSVRTIIVNCENGIDISSSVWDFNRWKKGKYCDPAKNQFRQHPMDHIEGIEGSVREALSSVTRSVRENITGISVDTTGSTPGPVDITGTPLALTPGFEENPNAMFVLWKDHTAVEEAEEINHVSHTWGGIDFTKYVGGVYSSEWFWAKMLHILREDEKVRKAAFSWVENCDWIPALLTGNKDPLKIMRSRCAAGHKAMWHREFNGLPSEGFLQKIDPLLEGIRSRLYTETYTCDRIAGTLSPEWAKKLGLSERVVVGAGAYDAHLGAVGAGVEPYILCKVIGTSTCDMLVAPADEIGDKLIGGICGQVDGSIIPGLVGMEAGQSAFGDIYAWFRDILMFPVRQVLSKNSTVDASVINILSSNIEKNIIPELSAAAESISLEMSSIIALDWLNGRRTPYADQRLKGAVTGICLGTDAPGIFRALVEATAFGARKIIDRFIDEGINIMGVIALGGIPKKSPFIMQVLSDVLNCPIKIARSDQACALGSAMAAATVSGIYPDIRSAQKAMGRGFEIVYNPDQKKAEIYDLLYKQYTDLGGFMENLNRGI